MKKVIFPIVLVSIATFLLVYAPYYQYSFPRHIDEWHHITEAIRLQEGEYPGGFAGYRIGFQIIILLLSKITNLVVFYKFLPATWAVFSGIVLFYVVYKKTGDQFFTALFAMIFFASIKSNVNITGLWFFTPLTFSIPFIYLYVYFFTEGIEKQNKRPILLSLGLMLILLFVHSISVLFAIPFLFIYVVFNLKYIAEEWRFFSLFLIVPLIGVLFYKFMTKVPWESLTGELIYALKFKRGWGVLELRNSLFELYSLIGYILAIIGLSLVFIKENIKKYLAYGLWPITVLISIIIYRKTGISYLSPYQRNLYYLAISLPVLSAFGLDYLFKLTKESIDRVGLAERKKDISKKIGIAALFIIITIFTFIAYFDIPKQIDLYQVIDDDDYHALLFLSSLPEKSVVLAPPSISVALYPISRHTPVATYFFYGKRQDTERFFLTQKCEIKQKILDKYKVKYVLTKSRINCGWKLIYDEADYIYEVD